MQVNEKLHTSRRIVRVNDLPTLRGYEWLTKSALRHLIFQSKPRLNSRGEAIKTNGLVESGAVIRIGRKILFDLDKFDLWVDSHRHDLGE